MVQQNPGILTANKAKLINKCPIFLLVDKGGVVLLPLGHAEVGQLHPGTQAHRLQVTVQSLGYNY